MEKSTVDFITNLLNLIDILEIEKATFAQKYVSPVKLRKMYKNMCKGKELLFQIMKQRNNDYIVKEAVKLGRLLTHCLLERCYWVRYGDSAMVSDLLKALFELDGHLGKVFDYQQLYMKLESIFTNLRVSDYETTWTVETLSSEEVKPFSYFLEHSNKMKTLFANQRLAEISFVQSISTHFSLIQPPSSKAFIFPEILIQLLQYGLFAKAKPDEDEIGKLVTGVTGVVLCSSYWNSSDSAHIDDYTSRIIKAGNVLLRAVPRVKKSSLLQYQKLRNRTQMMQYILQEMSVPKVLPTLMLRCTGPQELQHLCRRTIRQVLYNNWMLPQGIILLPLPSLMKEYINLEFDF